jgi:TfoX/Sxy family transcriptional regulator of competence genes
MAYDLKLAARIREQLSGMKNVEEKQMMGGLTFMVDNKMCVGIIKDELMCRIDPEIHEACIRKKGCRTMDFTKRPMRGFVIVNESGMKGKKELAYWVSLALEYNKMVKPSKKKQSAKK